MTRSNARELAAHLIYSMDYTGQTADEIIEARLERDYYASLASEQPVYEERPSKKQLDYVRQCVAGVDACRETLRAAIGRYAVGWKVGRISRFVLAVMELAMYEMLHVDDVPDSVAISEAVALTKKYEDDEVGAFVNGILGKFVREGKVLSVPSAPDDEAVEV